MWDPRGARLKFWGLVIGAGVVAGALSTLALGARLAQQVVTPARKAAVDVRVRHVRREGERIVATLHGTHAQLPGKYSFIFDDDAGHARLGPVIRATAAGVDREVLRVDHGQLREGAAGRITGWWYTDPHEFGYRVERIQIPFEHGIADAWVVHPRWARKGRWAVHVHGRGSLPMETFRGVPPFIRAGVTSLIISYRNDPGAPAGVRGRYGLGVSESRDVDSAIAEALRRGATRVTLFGWSMGGTACLIAATRGPNRDLVDGLVLDSPAVDWESVVRHHAKLSHLPKSVAGIGIVMLENGVVCGGEPGGIELSSLSAEKFAADITIPVLIHASRDDTYVPSDGAERLASANPRHVQLRLQERGEHVKLWNVDPEPWERATQAFVRAIPRRGA